MKVVNVIVQTLLGLFGVYNIVVAAVSYKANKYEAEYFYQMLLAFVILLMVLIWRKSDSIITALRAPEPKKPKKKAGVTA